ncbi:MAG TPA: hypothetical protein VLH35_02945 [Candidatus Acidoferrales bacterium]|nr:hypothetical protein [Candidatus Acidoferrales bacterium]
MKRIVSIAAIITIIIIGVVAAVVLQSTLNQTTQTKVTPRELDFTVSGKNACLRFLNDSVSVVYVPIATGANENWELTINATKMAGGAGGWVDLYTYDGYWDGGVNNTCLSRDVYPILANIADAEAQLKASEPYTQTFGGAAAETHTLFFIYPPGGQSTFHVTLKQI